MHRSRHVVTGFLLAVTIIASPVLAAQVPAKSASVMNPAIDAVVTSALAQRFTHGLAVAVVHNGQVIYARGFGYAGIGKRSPVTPQTPFAIGSLTKQFTALLALQLVQEHKLSLDATIARWLPMLPNARTITVRELLNQTSGLHNYPLLSEHPWPLHGTIHLKQLLVFMAQDHPDFAPGMRWEYSNTDYTALAAIVSDVTGQPYSTLLDQRIFHPLQMTHSGYGYAAQQRLHPALSFMSSPTGIAALPKSQRVSLDLFSGSGGIVTSASDLARWDMALLAGRLLNAKSRALWWTPGRLADGAPTTYGMGWVVSRFHGERELWHNGFAPGAGGMCYNALFPQLGLGIVVLSDTGSFSPGADTRLGDLVGAIALTVAPEVAHLSASPGADAAITALVRTLWADYAAGRPPLAEMESSFAKLFTPAFIAQLSAGVRAYGTPHEWIYLGKQMLGNGITMYRYRLELANGSTPTFAIGLDAAGRIAGTQLFP
ncbi:MAG: serine hydrolase domain-containing protein [Vulcanimicrobiaceae bacterium]